MWQEKPGAATDCPESLCAQQASHPLIVAYYAAIRLELLWRLDMEISQGSSHAGGANEAIAVIEWGDGALPHTHNMRWIAGSPRCDVLQRGADVGRAEAGAEALAQ